MALLLLIPRPRDTFAMGMVKIIVLGDYKWHLYIYPKGEQGSDYLALYLEVDDYQSLPSGWRRNAQFRLTIVNQKSQDLSVQKASTAQRWFDKPGPGWGFKEMISFTTLNAKDGGFLVNDELLVAAEVEVLDVDGILGQPVRRISELHPDVASKFRGKNQNLKTTCMSFLLSLMETLRQPVKELSYEDLEEADMALTYLKYVNFKVDWLETELEQVKKKKETEEA
ncbi:hypothetical protein AALP_AA6G178800 [Arabis alpina]|uniref:MATH domain-containing protein n=1 Tax=Arabis alpina TaxID=50452 RepID=A0A087GPY4_ARAAL|nr:hypothetical protein AALP_AA6G178800 [Arabis alpina]